VIVEWLFGAFESILHVVLGALPVVEVPTWMDTTGPMATVFGYAASMGVWVPTTLLVTVLGALLAAWLMGFAIKAIRIVASFMTVGGGSAG
jgi:hypothetical protein